MSDQLQGKGAPEAPQGESGDAPKYVTEEQLNRAISARLGAFEKKQEKSFGDFSSKLDTVLSGLTKPKEEPTHSPQGGGSDLQSGPKVEEHPAFKALQRQLDEHKKLTERIAAERDTETARARDKTLRQTLQEKLAASGVQGAQLKHAIGYLVDAQKMVRIQDGTEDLLFKDGQDELPLEDGLKSWLKSEDAKIYLPPRGTTGSGERPTPSNVRGTGAPDAHKAAEDAVAAFYGLNQ